MPLVECLSGPTLLDDTCTCIGWLCGIVFLWHACPISSPHEIRCYRPKMFASLARRLLQNYGIIFGDVYLVGGMDYFEVSSSGLW